jgi:hypothetical protein
MFVHHSGLTQRRKNPSNYPGGKWPMKVVQRKGLSPFLPRPQGPGKTLGYRHFLYYCPVIAFPPPLGCARGGERVCRGPKPRAGVASRWVTGCASSATRPAGRARGAWPQFRGKTGVIVQVNVDRQRPRVTEYRVVFGLGRTAHRWVDAIHLVPQILGVVQGLRDTSTGTAGRLGRVSHIFTS